MKKIIAYILCGIIAFIITYMGRLDSVDKTFEDRVYHSPTGVSDKIKIIKIDDKTMNKYGDISGWDRGMYAKLVNTLCVSEEIRPNVIGFDVLFSSPKDTLTDAQFVAACRKYNNVVAGFSYVFTKEVVTDEEGYLVSDTMVVEEKVLPFDALKNVTEQGFVNALIDEDSNVIRNAFLSYDEGNGEKTRSLNAAVFEKYMESIGEEALYPTKDSVLNFRFSGGVSDYENISMCDVLEGTVPAETFDDCIVLVGAYAAGMMDAYFVPVDNGIQMYGVEIHANVVQALIEGKIIVNSAKWLDALICAIIVITLSVLGSKLKIRNTILLCIGVILAKLGIDYLLFQNGYSVNHIMIPIMTFVVTIFYIVVHYIKTRNAKRHIEQAFNKYVAPQVVKEITKDGQYELKLGGEKKNVAVLFVDIRGFTSLSENLEPEQVVDILNNYLELTTSCIFKHGGTLDKFIGDATMAVYNAPFDLDDYIFKAILSAWDIVQGGNKIEKEFMERYGKQVGFGVGINCGPAVVGNIGCEFRMDYTTIGDTVNTAERLEANAPRGKVYISREVYEQVKERIEVEEVGEIPLKGKSKSVFVYSITNIKEDVVVETATKEEVVEVESVDEQKQDDTVMKKEDYASISQVNVDFDEVVDIANLIEPKEPVMQSDSVGSLDLGAPTELEVQDDEIEDLLESDGILDTTEIEKLLRKDKIDIEG